jgi:hypothetical protein
MNLAPSKQRFFFSIEYMVWPASSAESPATLLCRTACPSSAATAVFVGCDMSIVKRLVTTE